MGSDDCKGRDCRHFDECFAERAKAEAERAGVFVTNYHMLFAHLTIRAKTQMNLVLPPFDVAICDEAHKAADIARDFNGFRMTEGSARFASRILGRMQQQEMYEELEDAASKFFVDLKKHYNSPAYKTRFRSPPTLRWNGLREILGRTRGSIVWGLYYATFVVAAAVHGAIGVRSIASEWAGMRGRAAQLLMWGVGLVLAVLGLRAVAAVVL